MAWLEVEDHLLLEDCRELVDLCEQEIMGGDSWESGADGDAVRDREIESLRRSVLGQLGRVLRDGAGVVELRPAYAVAQREGYAVHLERCES